MDSEGKTLKNRCQTTRGRRKETESAAAPTRGAWMASEKMERTDEEQGFKLKNTWGLLLSSTGLGWPGHCIAWLGGGVRDEGSGARSRLAPGLKGEVCLHVDCVYHNTATWMAHY